MLLSIGSLGLLIELYNPGLIFPGVIGAISVLLAFYSLQTLPVNYAGLGLIGLAFRPLYFGIADPELRHAHDWGPGLDVFGRPHADRIARGLFAHSALTTIFVVVGTTGGLMALVVGAAARSFNGANR